MPADSECPRGSGNTVLQPAAKHQMIPAKVPTESEQPLRLVWRCRLATAHLRSSMFLSKSSRRGTAVDGSCSAPYYQSTCYVQLVIFPSAFGDNYLRAQLWTWMKKIRQFSTTGVWLSSHSILDWCHTLLGGRQATGTNTKDWKDTFKVGCEDHESLEFQTYMKDNFCRSRVISHDHWMNNRENTIRPDVWFSLADSDLYIRFDGRSTDNECNLFSFFT